VRSGRQDGEREHRQKRVAAVYNRWGGGRTEVGRRLVWRIQAATGRRTVALVAGEQVA